MGNLNGTKRPWKRSEIATLKRMLKAGNTRDEVAEAIGRTPNAITTFKYNNEIPGRFPKTSLVSDVTPRTKNSRGRSWSANDIATLKRMLKAGNTKDEVAAELGRTTHAILAQKTYRRLPGRFPHNSTAAYNRSIPNTEGKTVQVTAEATTAPTINANIKIKTFKQLRKVLKVAKKENVNLNIQFKG